MDLTGTTPEKLLAFYRWLRTEPFFRNKAPPQIITGMPDRYPSWIEGRLGEKRLRDTEKYFKGKYGHLTQR